MTRYHMVTQSDAVNVAIWYQRAVNDIQVHRFLTGGNHFTTDGPKETNWECTYVMDNNRRGLLWLHADRSAHRIVTMGLHVLSGQGQQFAAGVLLKAAPYIAKHYIGGRYLEWCAHETNVKSLAASKLIGGKVWGKKEDSMWDSFLGEAVGSVHFRLKL